MDHQAFKKEEPAERTMIKHTSINLELNFNTTSAAKHKDKTDQKSIYFGHSKYSDTQKCTY